SPLAASSRSNMHAPRPLATRKHSFPQSRPLRPFASIAPAASPGRKPVKMIEPPKNFKSTFMLNLTQTEFSRQD
ncbi:hypothetical protein FIBSPDRAFT_700332, partial [Athelia psychrophila]